MKKAARYAFGEKIRTVRERRGLTLKGLAAQVRVSESLVSQIERNKVSPSIDTLLQLAEALEIDLEYLFQDFKRDKRVDIVWASERDIVRQQGVTYQHLSTIPDSPEEHAVGAFLLEIEPGSVTGDSTYGHPGKELGILLEGRGELVYGKKSYMLETGDSVTFSSDIPHLLKNRGERILRAIWIITPPRLLFGKT